MIALLGRRGMLTACPCPDPELLAPKRRHCDEKVIS